MKKILLLGDIDVNCYFIEHNNKCYIVDPGYEKEKVITLVERDGAACAGIRACDKICCESCKTLKAERG